MHKMHKISYFLTFFQKSIQLDLSSYTAIITAIQTAVINQFIALKKRTNEFYLKQTKIKLYSVVGYYRFLLHVFDQHCIRSMGLIL